MTVPAVRLRDVAIPSEHGGWSLTLEPVLLGLMVAPSGAGVVLGACALVAFLARTPLKLAAGDRWRKRRLDRTPMAERAALAYLGLLVFLFGVALLIADASFWQPLVMAAPLIAVEIWFDVRSRSRRLLPELAGTVGIGSVAAAVILAGAGGWPVALGAWVVVAARSVGTIPFVRLQLRRRKSQPHRIGASDLAQASSMLLAVGGALLDWVPWVAVLAVTALAAVQAWLSRIAVPRTEVIGAQQVVLGLAVVLVAGLALASP